VALRADPDRQPLDHGDPRAGRCGFGRSDGSQPCRRYLSALVEPGAIRGRGGVGGAPFVVIVHGDPITLTRRAQTAGALFVLASDPLGYCNPPAKVSRS